MLNLGTYKLDHILTIEKTSDDHPDLGYMCGFGCIDCIFWCNWLFLTWDQIIYWAVKIVTGVLEAIPVIGLPLVELFRESSSVGKSNLIHFYSLHTFVLPILIVVFILMHFLMVRKQGISNTL